jgi:plasmid stabilization system protein ParE
VSRHRVVFTKVAERQTERVGQWWRANRLAAPELFTDELERVQQLIAEVPLIGKPYLQAPRLGGVRRVLLEKSGYHVYYTVDEQHERVIIRSVWHAARGRGPRL